MTVELLEQMIAGQAPEIVPITVEQYQQMITAGIVAEGAPIELIDGLLVRKDRSKAGEDPMTYHPLHAFLIGRLERLLSAWCQKAGCHLRTQRPITLGKTSQPEPDAAVVHGSLEEFVDRHPGAEDILALIEVSDSSLKFDRTTKQRLYAQATVPTYWIVNAVDTQVEVYELPDPSAGRYGKRTDHRPGQKVRLAAGRKFIDIKVSEIFA